MKYRNEYNLNKMSNNNGQRGRESGYIVILFPNSCLIFKE